eukprot:1058000-Rhodomonas_salina.1
MQCEYTCGRCLPYLDSLGPPMPKPTSAKARYPDPIETLLRPYFGLRSSAPPMPKPTSAKARALVGSQQGLTRVSNRVWVPGLCGSRLWHRRGRASRSAPRPPALPPPCSPANPLPPPRVRSRARTQVRIKATGHGLRSRLGSQVTSIGYEHRSRA